MPVLLPLLVLFACAPKVDEDPSTPDDTPSADGPWGFLPDAAPPPVTDDEIGADALLLTRLEVHLAADADEAGLREALATVGGALAASRPGLPWITVTVPPFADLEGAVEVAGRLSAHPAILVAGPAHLVEPPALPVDAAPGRAAPPGAGGELNRPRGMQGFYSAWHMAPLASTRVPVWVVDGFTVNAAPAQLEGMTFTGMTTVEPQLTYGDAAERLFLGNHGFWVASLIGAAADEVPPVGTHADPGRSLSLHGVNFVRVGGILDTILLMDRTLPTAGFFVLNTSFRSHPTTTASEHALAAIAWREAILRRDPFFVAAASGNDGHDPEDTWRASPMIAQAAFDDLSALAPGDAAVAEVWAQAIARRGDAMRARVRGTLVVGASSLAGQESRFSNRGADVRAIGEELAGVCTLLDPLCSDLPQGRLMVAEGTSGAAPTVAGLAAWLRSIDPTLTPGELAEHLLDHFDDAWVDAFRATLALQRRGVPVHRVWFDPTPDDPFDHLDLELLLLAIDDADAQVDLGAASWPRADLNGDGWASAETFAAIDVDGDGVTSRLRFEVAGSEASVLDEAVLDESRVSDLALLCWAAHGPLYGGDVETRDALLRGRCGGAQPTLVGSLSWTRTVENPDPACPQYTANASVELEVLLDGTIVSISGGYSQETLDGRFTWDADATGGEFTGGGLQPGANGRLHVFYDILPRIDGVAQPSTVNNESYDYVVEEDGTVNLGSVTELGFCRVRTVVSGVLQ